MTVDLHTTHQAFNTANARWREGKWTEALGGYDEAARLDPTLALAQLGRARCLVRLNELAPAREAFAACLRLDPANYSAWLEAGHLCRQMGELQQAAGAYQRAIDCQPDRYEAHLAMARVLQQLGQGRLAEQAFTGTLLCLDRDTKLAGDSAKKAVQIANAAQRMGQYSLESGHTAAAVQALITGLQTLPQTDQASVDLRAELQIDLGDALWRQGQHDKAKAALTQASAASTEATLVRLADLSFRLNHWQEALAILRRNVELHPQSIAAHWNLAHLLAECWQMDEAEQVLQQAEAMGPVAGAQKLRATIASRQGDADTALQIYREQAAATPGATLASNAAMVSLYSDKLSALEVANLHNELFAPMGQGARAADSFRRPPLAGRRLRLGLVSADFHHQHPVNIFMQPVLREIDHNQFEVFVYFTGVSYDEQTRLAQRRVEHWVEATTLNDAQLAKRIDTDGIDLLLDLAGHTGQQRMTLFAKRAAPVQATYLGYPGSTGVPNMDWLIADGVVAPAGSDALFSERVARLPGTVFCFAPEANYPFPSYPDECANRPLTFGSFNNVPKLTPHTLKLWAKVLAAVPGSRLLLKAPSFIDPGATRAFGQRLSALGVDLARVEFRGPVGLDDMMAEYADIDIALDPVPYNGGTTSLQALWMGVPVLCKMGEHFVSRMGASFMTAAGMPDWVAKDDEAYVAIAQRMAADRQGLLALKRGLRDRLTTLPAWDIKAHTRAFERALLGMCRT
ncbi:tetratricopeptide repeat protein [Aquabacterium sp.]|uniref:tetratricopeptide repeat protein n=1 Tax=Aquabacterium sp. TaxID=1872578 RepID=UPI003D03DAAC